MNDVRLISTHGNPLAERMVDLAPQVMEKLEALLQKRNRQQGEQPLA